MCWPTQSSSGRTKKVTGSNGAPHDELLILNRARHNKVDTKANDLLLQDVDVMRDQLERVCLPTLLGPDPCQYWAPALPMDYIRA
jgi:hypothetical protein